MRSLRQRLAAATVLTGLTALGIGLAAGPAGAAVRACEGYVGAAQSGSLHFTSTPPDSSDVPVGSVINLAGTWNDHEFDETDRIFICATVNDVWNEGLSSEDRGVNNNGSYSAAAAIPSDTPVGSDVCFLGVLRGRSAVERVSIEMVSETLCFRAAAVATTTTMATTTTTTAPVVEPEVVDAGTPAAPAVEAAPAPAVEPAPLPVLPRTGGGPELLTGFGGLALAAGGVARFLGRRRPSEG